MKKIKILLASSVLFLILGISACQKDNVVSSPANDSSDFNTMILSNSSALPGEMQDGTIESDINYLPSPEAPIAQNDVRFLPLGRILQELALSDSQKVHVKFLYNRYIHCVMEVRRALIAYEQEIIKNSNEKRREILLALKNGEITRQQALEALKILNQRTREALNSNIAKAEAKAALKNCLDNFFDAVTKILDNQQKVKWLNWVAEFWQRF